MFLEARAGERPRCARRRGRRVRRHLRRHARDRPGTRHGRADAAPLLEGEASFALVGDGPLKAPLVQLAAEARRCATSRSTRRCRSTEMPPLLAASDALLVPLSAHPTFRDFVPSKLIDAMAVGRPVIVSASGRVGADPRGAGRRRRRRAGGPRRRSHERSAGCASTRTRRRQWANAAASTPALASAPCRRRVWKSCWSTWREDGERDAEGACAGLLAGRAVRHVDDRGGTRDTRVLRRRRAPPLRARAVHPSFRGVRTLARQARPRGRRRARHGLRPVRPRGCGGDRRRSDRGIRRSRAATVSSSRGSRPTCASPTPSACPLRTPSSTSSTRGA